MRRTWLLPVATLAFATDASAGTVTFTPVSCSERNDLTVFRTPQARTSTAAAAVTG